MPYTQKQVREIVDLTPETIRIWRQALPPLMATDRQGLGRFSFGDLIALAILKTAVDQFEAKISCFKDVAPQLFDLCQAINVSRPPWALTLSEVAADVHALPTGLLSLGGTFLLIPLRPIITHLQARTVAERMVDEQFNLPLLPSTS